METADASAPVRVEVEGTEFFVLPVAADGSIGDSVGQVGIGDSLDVSEVFEATARVGELMRDRLKRLAPDKTTVEIEVGFAASSGRIFALLGSAEGAGSIKVSLEWARADE